MSKSASTKKLKTMQKRIKPIDYLIYANKDLLDQNSRGEVNALTNIKRAIDSQLDVLLEMFGLLALTKRWNFPNKINLLNQTGVLTPNILQSINQLRNRLEHEHEKPSREKVIEYLGIAELFIELYKNRSHRIDLIIDYDLDYAVWLDEDNKVIKIFNNTKLIYESGGGVMFHELIAEKKIIPIKEISITDLDEWTHACKQYFHY